MAGTGSGDIHVAGTGSFALEVAEYARDVGVRVQGVPARPYHGGRG